MTINESFLAGLWNDAKAEVAKLESAVVAEAKSLFADVEADAATLLKKGLPVAINAVIAEAPKALSGEEKFGNAVTAVAQALESAEGPAAIADVRSIVQTAYRWLPSLLALV